MADWMEELERLAELRDKDLITDEEFEVKRKEIVNVNSKSETPSEEPAEIQEMVEETPESEDIVSVEDVVKETSETNKSLPPRPETESVISSTKIDSKTGVMVASKKDEADKLKAKAGVFTVVIIIIGIIVGVVSSQGDDSPSSRNTANDSASQNNSSTSNNNSTNNSDPLGCDQSTNDAVETAFSNFQKAEEEILRGITAGRTTSTMIPTLDIAIPKLTNAVSEMNLIASQDTCFRSIRSEWSGITEGFSKIISGYRTLEQFYRTGTDSEADRSVRQLEDGERQIQRNLCKIGEILDIGIQGKTFTC
tara:strand:- start:126 stop:1049 length:924 start_codon:yes stop_codon:yes gene_type:complete